MKINILRGALFTGALALLAAALTALPANAAGYEGCPDGSLCLYSGSGGTNADGDADEHYFDLSKNKDGESYGTWSSKPKSLINNSPYWACVYSETAYGGQVKAIPPKVKDTAQQGDLAGLAPALGGKVNSHKLALSQGHCFTGFERCEDGKLCIFHQASGRGGMYSIASDHPGYKPIWAGKVGSVSNRTDKSACFYGKPAAEVAQDKPFRVLPGDSTTVTEAFAPYFVSHTLRDKGCA